LRRVYKGKIVVYAYPESIDTVQFIAADPRLEIEARLWEPPYRGKNGQFLNKIMVMQQADSDVAMYLDADTMVARDISHGFEYGLTRDFIATQFCDWVSNSGTIKKRVSRLLGRDPINQQAVKSVLETPHPSVNGGVFFCRPSSEVLDKWLEWSMAVKDIFICDETALHAVMGHYMDLAPSDRRWFGVIGHGAYNCSPKYRPIDLKDDDVYVWHGHGDSFVRENKCKFGVELWLPEFKNCLHQNLGGCRRWMPKVNNRFLTKLLESRGIVA
jgi:hypothetical protein